MIKIHANELLERNTKGKRKCDVVTNIYWTNGNNKSIPEEWKRKKDQVTTFVELLLWCSHAWLHHPTINASMNGEYQVQPLNYTIICLMHDFKSFGITRRKENNHLRISIHYGAGINHSLHSVYVFIAA